MPSYCQKCREERVANQGDLCSSCKFFNEMTPKEKADRARLIAQWFGTKTPERPTVLKDELDRRRPGPKPKRPGRRFDYEHVYNLRKSGLSFGQIAQSIWNDPSKRNRASAHYRRAIKSGFPPIKPSGK
jgi:hypothetical protein